MQPAHIAFPEAVHGQPRHLSTAVEHITRSLDAAQLTPWLPCETIAILGMGASTNSAHALVAALTERGVRSTNIAASELASAPANFEAGDHYLLVTESGRSPEPIDAARTRGIGRRIAITNFPDSPVAEVADHTIEYGGIDDSPVYTSGYLATLTSYAALLNTMGLDAHLDIAEVPALVADALERFEPRANALTDHLTNVTAVDLVGQGFGYCSATQGALLFREALRLPASGWNTYQYIHGPNEAAGASTALVIIGDGRELDIVPQHAAAGTTVIVVSAAPEADLARISGDNVHIVSLAHTTPGFARTIAETVVLQLLAEKVAAARNINIGAFRHQQSDTKLP